MVIDWPYKALREISTPHARSFAMGPFGSNIRKENYRLAGVPVIRGLNLNAERFYDAGFVFLTEEKADELRNSSAFPQDIVFVAQGTIGQVGIIPKHARYPRYVLSQNLMKVTCDTDKVDPLYVFYYFRSHYGQHEIFAYANPTGVPCISQPLTSLKSFRVPMVPLSKQRAITAVLSSLDDKIEQNRQMNQTLEAMAQALFKSWFVDFEPFCDQGMEDSPLGPIPRGWRCTTVPEVIEVNPSRKVERGANAIYIDMASLPTVSARVLSVIRRSFTGSGSKFRNGDVLLARITPCLENGKTSIVDFLEDGETGWGSTEFIVLGPKPPLSMSFIYCLARNPDFRAHAIQAMTGTSGRQRVDSGCFDNYWLAGPPKSIADRFDQKVWPWFQMIKANDDESHTIATIRDTLLPKLLSGEIRVKDAEKFIEEAA